MQRHPRQLLSDLLDVLNPIKDGRADGDSTADTQTDNTDTTPTDNTLDTTDTTPSSSQPTSRTSPTSDTQRTSRTTSDRETDTTSDTRPSSDTSTSDESSTSRTSRTSRTSNTSSSEEDTPSPTPDSSSTHSTTKPSSLVVVTVTRTGSTITTFEPAAPTIDQANGEKADVGTSENLPTIIAAPVATAVALMLFAVLYYLHRRRRNRIRYSDDDTFSKTPSNPVVKPYVPPNKSMESSPFDLRTHHNNGYNVEHSDGYHTAQQMPNDSTSLLPNSQYQQPAHMGPAAAGAAAMYGARPPQQFQQQRPPQQFQQQ
ncbi:hypothetical protein FB639_006543, partial [Coemansia asiatica]